MSPYPGGHQVHRTSFLPNPPISLPPITVPYPSFWVTNWTKIHLQHIPHNTVNWSSLPVSVSVSRVSVSVSVSAGSVSVSPVSVSVSSSPLSSQSVWNLQSSKVIGPGWNFNERVSLSFNFVIFLEYHFARLALGLELN